jgi:hypothetical protein
MVSWTFFSALAGATPEECQISIYGMNGKGFNDTFVTADILEVAALGQPGKWALLLACPYCLLVYTNLSFY